MTGGIRIGRIFGINIRIDWSWLFIFFLIAWNLGTSFSRLHPDWGTGLAWVIGVVAALLFFVSVLIHELAHSLVAVSQGVPVRGITLFLFGGVSNIQRDPPSPKAEFLIAIVGPIASIVIGVVLTWLVGVSLGPIDTVTATEEAISLLNPVATMFAWLGSINILLALFNLIPGFPLDGGRVLRSILWAATNNLRQATRWATWVGQAIAWLFIIAGIAMVFGARVPLLGAGLINGLWLAFIGWFLNTAASQSYQQLVMQEVLEDVPVARLMRRNPPTTSGSSSVSQLVYDYAMGTDDYAFPVMDGDKLIGIVTLDDVRSVSRDQWDATRVADIMTPVDRLVLTTINEDAADAVRKLIERDVRQLPVMHEGRLAGLLRRRDIMRWLQLHSDAPAVSP